MAVFQQRWDQLDQVVNSVGIGDEHCHRDVVLGQMLLK
jgi:hypothetical protein